MIMGIMDKTADTHADFIRECSNYFSIRYTATQQQVESFIALSGDFSVVIKHLEMMQRGMTYIDAREAMCQWMIECK